jgi:hypothetical protein
MVSTRSRHDRRALAAVTVVAILLVLAVAAGRPQAAAAGGPGVWTDISGPVGSLLVQPDASRAGGLLHVAWVTEGTPQYLKYTSISSAGAQGATQVLTPGGWNSLSNPAVLAAPSGSSATVLVFAGGIDPADVHDGLSLWGSFDDGGSFVLAPGLVSGPGGIAYSSNVSAVQTPGSVFETWFGTAGVFTHQGETAGGDVNVNDVGDFGYDSAFGYDPVAGKLYVVAAYNATGKQGLWARSIDPASGAPVGSSFNLPRSTTAYAGSQEFDPKITRTPVTGLVGQSAVLVAYPTGYPSSTTVRVWRLTPGGAPTSSAVLASGGGEKNVIAIAADPDGRAWVVWSVSSGSRQKVYAVRSNVGGTAWGQVVSVAGPAGTASLYQLAASAQSDRVDVLAQYQKGADNDIFHTQLLTGLKVTASPAKIKAGKTTTVSVTVTDAGSGVAGAKATIGAKSGTTSAAGVAKVKVKATKAGKLKVTVKKTGYALGSATLSVVR